jgi:hypothetical protein
MVHNSVGFNLSQVRIGLPKNGVDRTELRRQSYSCSGKKTTIAQSCIYYNCLKNFVGYRPNNFTLVPLTQIIIVYVVLAVVRNPNYCAVMKNLKAIQDEVSCEILKPVYVYILGMVHE